MAVPSFVAASTGATDATGGWTATCHAPGAADRIIILQFLADGTSASYPTISSTTNIKDLAGTSGQWTRVTAAAGEDVGSPKVASQHIYIGRSTGTSAPVVTGANVGGDDVYWRFYEFQDVSSGATLATVIENSSAGAIVNGAGTNATVSDTGVTTLGVDRLALQFVGINDDNAQAAFTGETGGDWTEAVAEYADAGGTDASIGLQTSLPATLVVDGTDRSTTVSSSIQGETGGNERLAQSFVIASQTTLLQVDVFLYKQSAPTDNVVVSIEADSGGSPSGTPLASSSKAGGTIATTPGALYPFTFSLSLSAGTYWVVVSRDGARDTTNRYLWWDSLNPISSSEGLTRNSGTWSAHGADRSFGIRTNSAGTINGGTFTQADGTDGWGVVGFALIGTTVISTDLHPHFLNQVLSQAVNRASTY